jgi:hypothetical protein
MQDMLLVSEKLTWERRKKYNISPTNVQIYIFGRMSKRSNIHLSQMKIFLIVGVLASFLFFYQPQTNKTTFLPCKKKSILLSSIQGRIKDFHI